MYLYVSCSVFDALAYIYIFCLPPSFVCSICLPSCQCPYNSFDMVNRLWWFNGGRNGGTTAVGVHDSLYTYELYIRSFLCPSQATTGFYTACCYTPIYIYIYILICTCVWICCLCDSIVIHEIH